MLEAANQLEAMYRRLKGLSQPDFRTQRILDELALLDELELAYFLERAYIGAIRQERAGQWVLESLDDFSLLREKMAPKRLMEVTRLADQDELYFAAESLSPGIMAPKKPPRMNSHRDLSELTLGERRFLAKSCNMTLLEKLLVDPQPMVIQNLLQHPRLLERHVVQIGARVPTNPDVLMVLARHPKWSRRYAVKKTLVQNPYSPGWLVMRLLPYLERQDLKLLQQSPRFSARFIERFLTIKRGPL